VSRKTSRPERSLAADICLWLALHGYRQVRCVAGLTRARVGQETPETANPAGFPDWVFVLPKGRSVLRVDGSIIADPPGAIFIEMKRPGKRPTKLQQAWLDRLRLDGFTAEWFDGFQPDEGCRSFMTWWLQEVEERKR